MKVREVSHHPVSDTTSKGRNPPAMSDIRREEFNARIEIIETRMDARVNEVSANIDTWVNEVSAKIDAFMLAQAERDKAYFENNRERDKRYDLIWEGMQRLTEESKAANKQASTVKASYWAATTVHLLGVITLVVGAHFANQAAVLATVQTALAAVQVGKDIGAARRDMLPTPLPSQ